MGKSPTPWTFAHVWIRNKPLPRGVRSVLVRESAAGCTVISEFRRGGELALPEVSARWSSRPEPTRIEFSSAPGEPPIGPTGATGPQVVAGTPETHREVMVTYDPGLVPQTLTLDLAPDRWEEVAIAILFEDGAAFAWGAESYADGGRRPEWRLDRAEYDVTLRVESSGIRSLFRFALDNLSTDFSRFRLKPR